SQHQYNYHSPLLPPTLPTSRSTNLNKYFDKHKECLHVMLPREPSKQVPKTHLMSEEEWRRPGVQQSLGWVHYRIHNLNSQPQDQELHVPMMKSARCLR
uniref:Cyclin-dependent kinases regulatory subunit n=1 Tax=Ailuropoda melanoleuca TaxID=9646 RepID=A0A7N5JY11_AILME